MHFNEWGKKEVAQLKKLYPLFRVKYLVKYFPKRNKATIAAKALNLGLQSAKLWQTEDNKMLQLKFRASSKEELLRLFPKRTWSAIMAQGERLGIKRNRNHPKLAVNEDYFKKWSSNMAYILGYILTDGCIIRGSYKGYSDSLKFGVQLKDQDILKKIKRELGSAHSISITRNAAYLCIASQKIVDSLKHLSIDYKKSLKEKIPNVPNKYKKDFIRGMIDGDGGISINSRSYPTLRLYGGINTINFVRDYFWNNFKAYSNIGKRESKLASNIYLCYIAYRTNTAIKLIDFLYKDAKIFLDRKYKLAMQCGRIQIRTRNNFTSIYEKATYYSGEPNEI
jgi:hypothetical protein